jgi:hypothetical protein
MSSQLTSRNSRSRQPPSYHSDYVLGNAVPNTTSTTTTSTNNKKRPASVSSSDDQQQQEEDDDEINEEEDDGENADDESEVEQPDNNNNANNSSSITTSSNNNDTSRMTIKQLKHLIATRNSTLKSGEIPWKTPAKKSKLIEIVEVMLKTDGGDPNSKNKKTTTKSKRRRIDAIKPQNFISSQDAKISCVVVSDPKLVSRREFSTLPGAVINIDKGFAKWVQKVVNNVVERGKKYHTSTPISVYMSDTLLLGFFGCVAQYTNKDQIRSEHISADDLFQLLGTLLVMSGRNGSFDRRHALALKDHRKCLSLSEVKKLLCSIRLCEILPEESIGEESWNHDNLLPSSHDTALDCLSNSLTQMFLPSPTRLVLDEDTHASVAAAALQSSFNSKSDRKVGDGPQYNNIVTSDFNLPLNIRNKKPSTTANGNQVQQWQSQVADFVRRNQHLSRSLLAIDQGFMTPGAAATSLFPLNIPVIGPHSHHHQNLVLSLSEQNVSQLAASSSPSPAASNGSSIPATSTTTSSTIAPPLSSSTTSTTNINESPPINPSPSLSEIKNHVVITPTYPLYPTHDKKGLMTVHEANYGESTYLGYLDRTNNTGGVYFNGSSCVHNTRTSGMDFLVNFAGVLPVDDLSLLVNHFVREPMKPKQNDHLFPCSTQAVNSLPVSLKALRFRLLAAGCVPITMTTLCSEWFVSRKVVSVSGTTTAELLVHVLANAADDEKCASWYDHVVGTISNNIPISAVDVEEISRDVELQNKEIESGGSGGNDDGGSGGNDNETEENENSLDIDQPTTTTSSTATTSSSSSPMDEVIIDFNKLHAERLSFITKRWFRLNTSGGAAAAAGSANEKFIAAVLSKSSATVTMAQVGLLQNRSLHGLSATPDRISSIRIKSNNGTIITVDVSEEFKTKIADELLVKAHDIGRKYPYDEDDEALSFIEIGSPAWFETCPQKLYRIQIITQLLVTGLEYSRFTVASTRQILYSVVYHFPPNIRGHFVSCIKCILQPLLNPLRKLGVFGNECDLSSPTLLQDVQTDVVKHLEDYWEAPEIRLLLSHLPITLAVLRTSNNNKELSLPPSRTIIPAINFLYNIGKPGQDRLSQSINSIFNMMDISRVASFHASRTIRTALYGVHAALQASSIMDAFEKLKSSQGGVTRLRLLERTQHGPDNYKDKAIDLGFQLLDYYGGESINIEPPKTGITTTSTSTSSNNVVAAITGSGHLITTSSTAPTPVRKIVQGINDDSSELREAVKHSPRVLAMKSDLYFKLLAAGRAKVAEFELKPNNPNKRKFWSTDEGNALRLSTEIYDHQWERITESSRCIGCSHYKGQERIGRTTTWRCKICFARVCVLCQHSFHNHLVLLTAEQLYENGKIQLQQLKFDGRDTDINGDKVEDDENSVE